MASPSYKNFDKAAYAWRANVDYRADPDAYRIGKGEQGVLICEPYKSELVAHWRFRTPKVARQSSTTLYRRFLTYIATGDFVGADMARKFLQMGFTRARRYTNYKGGRKYGADDAPLAKGTGDPLKALSADIFYKAWKRAESHPAYAAWKAGWKRTHG